MLPNLPIFSQTEQEIYLLRHGETALNAQGIIQGGGVDAPLNETGAQQAELFFSAYRDVAFDAVFGSGLQRTHQTLAPFAAAGHTIQRHPGLNEMSWGVLEGVKADVEVKKLYHEINARWMEGDLDASLEGGESPREVSARARAALQEILMACPTGRVLICSHGRLLRILLAELLGYGLAEMHHFGHSNTGLNILRRAGLRFTALRLNDTSHLD